MFSSELGGILQYRFHGTPLGDCFVASNARKLDKI